MTQASVQYAGQGGQLILGEENVVFQPPADDEMKWKWQSVENELVNRSKLKIKLVLKDSSKKSPIFTFDIMSELEQAHQVIRQRLDTTTSFTVTFQGAPAQLMLKENQLQVMKENNKVQKKWSLEDVDKVMMNSASAAIPKLRVVLKVEQPQIFIFDSRDDMVQMKTKLQTAKMGMDATREEKQMQPPACIHDFETPPSNASPPTTMVKNVPFVNKKPSNVSNGNNKMRSNSIKGEVPIDKAEPPKTGITSDINKLSKAATKVDPSGSQSTTNSQLTYDEELARANNKQQEHHGGIQTVHIVGCACILCLLITVIALASALGVVVMNMNNLQNSPNFLIPSSSSGSIGIGGEESNSFVNNTFPTVAPQESTHGSTQVGSAQGSTQTNTSIPQLQPPTMKPSTGQPISSSATLTMKPSTVLNTLPVYPPLDLARADHTELPTALLKGDAEGDYFGSVVSINGDGSIMAVGTPQIWTGSGKVRVYQRSGDNWQLLGSQLSGVNKYDGFGATLALSRDAKWLVVGAYNDRRSGKQINKIQLYGYDGTEWALDWGSQSDLDGSNEHNFNAVAFSGDGKWLAAAGVHNADQQTGFVRLFELSPDNQWQRRTPDLEFYGHIFHGEMDFNYDGTVLVIGASLNSPAFFDKTPNPYGKLIVFRRDPDASNWRLHLESFQGLDWYNGASSISVSDDGLIVAVGRAGGSLSPGSAEVLRYNPTEGMWVKHGQTLSGDFDYDDFGRSLALSGDGKTLVVGGEGKDIRVDQGGWGSRSLNSVGMLRVFHMDLQTSTEDWAQISENVYGSQERNDYVWVQVGGDIYGTEEGHEFGKAVTITADGRTFLGAAPPADSNTGNVRTFQITD